MEFIFVKTEELQEFEDSIKECIKILKKNTLQVIFGGLACYIMLVLLIVCL